MTNTVAALPTPPSIEGLPAWAQVLVSVIFCIGAIAAAYKGYFTRSDSPADAAKPNDPTSAQILAASIVDMGAIRNMTDAIVRLDASVGHLCREIEDAKHYDRQNLEAIRELCGRVRAATEVAEKVQLEGMRDLSARIREAVEIMERHLK